MTEDMDEQFAIGFQPGRDPRKKPLVIAHVFEHLDRDDAVELLIGGINARRVKLVHVCRDHLQVFDSLGECLCLDIFSLRSRIGDSCDQAVGVSSSHPQRQ
eukprot:TRINITY_DN38796_c1_g1_i1.p2 TRINITY_DN38796_c1_g1~~TRINITY_DN38796_c1_g1_i1.p2  ORF type:complete len:101 (-),score=0.98 TRINITY_DN38796_c1_g1_i1:403-705(-)